MKRFIYILSIYLSASSCSVSEMEPLGGGAGTGNIVVTISDGMPESKGTGTLDYEKNMNDVQFLIFRFSDGGLLWHSRLKNLDLGSRLTLPAVEVGSYTLWAVVNGPDCSMVETMEQLAGTEVLLEENSTDPERGLVMVGKKTVQVVAGQSSVVSLPVERLVAKVYVGNITNSLPEEYGPITIRGVFLANVVGNQVIGKGAQPKVWYNKYGSPTGVKGEYVDGTDIPAEASDMTWRKMIKTIGHGETVDIGAVVYSYRNTVTEFPFFPDAFTRSGPVLFLVYTRNGELRHCDIRLKSGLTENSMTRVDVEISGDDVIGEEGTAITLSDNLLTLWQSVSSGSFDI